MLCPLRGENFGLNEIVCEVVATNEINGSETAVIYAAWKPYISLL